MMFLSLWAAGLGCESNSANKPDTYSSQARSSRSPNNTTWEWHGKDKQLSRPVSNNR
jgi:hypothetical protein